MSIPLKQYWELLIDYLRPQRGRVLLLAILLFSNIGLQLANPQIIRRFLDLALAGRGAGQLAAMALLFIAVALVQQIAAVAATYLGENVSWTATNWLRDDLARHCLYLDMAFHNERTPGEMIERIDGDVNALSTFFSQFVLQILGNGLLLLGVLILLFREDVYAGAAITLFVVLTLAVINRLRNVAVPYWQQSREASARIFGFLEERLAGTEDIRASGAKAYTLRRSFELLRHWWRVSVFARVAGALMINTAWTLFAVGNAVAFLVGAGLYRSGALTLGSVYLLFHYTNMLGRPIERISQEMEQLQQAGAGIVRIRELFAVRSRLVEAPPAALSQPPGGSSDEHRSDVHRRDVHRPPPGGSTEVTLENVCFAYPAAATNGDSPEYVLQDVSFQLEPGRVLGLLGRTGSGKTTLTRLLFRLYDPTGGRIRLDGRDLRGMATAELRQQVGLVTQNVQLFHATVRDNLTFFDRAIPDQTILDVIHELGLARWYESLEEGLDTVLAAGGGGVSAGEGQLLAFTRIFLKDPGLVILDEASSRLDPATEQLIERVVDRLLQNRTAIIIAHRLNTVQRADEILILERGRILEHGSRPRLAADPNSRFYHLLQTGIEELLV
ncbi:MAG: ABC transporter ATP-binding protein/permease [Chloroflexi bacterium]|nr:ABC transporter ATP-binding protein/permease [Chloroflexota bacterium]MCI0576766.1 ABC transporter ATP-binding protein/permease [Chloroflexota bacterium]MCI0645972.1 ABC transporter ATP-binding protein/permease [Chloroflexota bacterium]MCI0731484.1 ABC transporter ATP-binding protein/permease [Chloroflexota bacterium]